MTNEGYRNLRELSSLAFLEGYYYKPRLDWDLLERYDGRTHRDVGLPRRRRPPGALARRLPEGARTRRSSADASSARRTSSSNSRTTAWRPSGAPTLSCCASRKDLRAPLLATNDLHYVHHDDAEMHDALLCIGTGSLVADPDRFRFESDQHYLKSAAEMRYLFRDLPEACDNTLAIAERANVTIEFDNDALPEFPLPDGLPARRRTTRARTALPARADVRAARASATASTCSDEVRSAPRLRTRRHRRHGLLGLLPRRVGPDPPRARAGHPRRARARIVGGLLRCVLPAHRGPRPAALRTDLRTLPQPWAPSMPDIDMDFDERYRGDMIRYAAERYGADHVAQIVTFSTIKARAAVRDAARVLGYPPQLGDKIAKAMPPLVMGQDLPARGLLRSRRRATRPATARRPNCAPSMRRRRGAALVDVAKGFVDKRRQDGIHAAAVVITKEPILDYVPVQRKSGPNGSLRGRADRHPVRGDGHREARVC